MFYEKIKHRKSGILTYGITPPKAEYPEEKIREIAARQSQRMKDLPVDGIVLYDIQDEKERTAEERPFPFMATIDPEIYGQQYLSAVSLPKIVYRCVGKYTKEAFANTIIEQQGTQQSRVFVGAASQQQAVTMRLGEAYDLYTQHNKDMLLGGVAIPERHMQKTDEHLRIVRKKEHGCCFFISQAVYNVQAARDLLSDYYYHCRQHNLEPVPIIFTLTPCGSQKTLDFMKWLGIHVPRWLSNDLFHAEDMLSHSVEVCVDIFRDLNNFAKEKELPVGFNVESVSIRKAEIEASLALIHTLATELKDDRKFVDTSQKQA